MFYMRRKFSNDISECFMNYILKFERFLSFAFEPVSEHFPSFSQGSGLQGPILSCVTVMVDSVAEVVVSNSLVVSTVLIKGWLSYF